MSGEPASRGALAQRLSRLGPLAAAKGNTFLTQLDRDLKDEPSRTLRFVRVLLDQMERQPATVRRDRISLLDAIDKIFERRLRRTRMPTKRKGEKTLTKTSGKRTTGFDRKLAAAQVRLRTIIEGAEATRGDTAQVTVNSTSARGPGATEERKAAVLSPAHALFGGNVRLAPSDPLPWPFTPTPTDPPSAVAPIRLVPMEWRNQEGHLVLGWEIRGE